MSRIWILVLSVAFTVLLIGCRSPSEYRREADRVAYDSIANTQAKALGRTEPFTIETPAETLRRRLLLDQHLPYAASASSGTHDVDPIKQWPDDDYLEKQDAGDGLADAYQADQPLSLTLVDALQIAAHESREYQSRKESVFEAALQLDLQRDSFRLTWSGVLEGMFETDLEEEIVIDDKGNTDTQNVSGIEYGGSLWLSQRFKNGMTFTGLIGIDLVTLLTQSRMFSRSVWADASISIPLMRGAGKFVVTEPLTQAERDVVYAIYEFERFKREFAVRIADDYLSVLRQKDQVQNEEENYRGLITSTRRARRLADAGRLPEIQVDQSFQDELRARNRWVAAIESYQRRLDAFKMTLGLPADAAIELDRTELETLAARAERLYEEKYISHTELEADRLTYNWAQLNSELAVASLDLLRNYTSKRKMAELESNVDQTKMALERVKLKANADIVQAEADLKAKDTELRQQRSKFEKTGAQIAKTKILAPRDGLVVYATSVQGGGRHRRREPLEEGQAVRERQELIYLPSAESMMAEVQIHESSLEKIRIGLPVRVEVDALPGKAFTGCVAKITPLPDAESAWLNPDLKVYPTQIHLDGSHPELRTGMSCRAEIVVEQHDNATYVPVQALTRLGTTPTVYLRAGKTFKPRTVEIGLDNNSMVHVLAGLEPGQEVLLAPPLEPAGPLGEEQHAAGPEMEQVKRRIEESKHSDEAGSGSENRAEQGGERHGSGERDAAMSERQQARPGCARM